MMFMTGTAQPEQSRMRNDVMTSADLRPYPVVLTGGRGYCADPRHLRFLSVATGMLVFAGVLFPVISGCVRGAAAAGFEIPSAAPAHSIAPSMHRNGAQDWREQPYPYVVVAQSVSDAMHAFGYNLGLRVAVAPDVQGVVEGRQASGTALDFLENVTHANDLDWYFDGTVLYVSRSASEQTAIVPLHGYSFDILKKGLEQDGLFDARFHLTSQTGGASAVVAGPPSFVAVIRQAIEARTSDTPQDTAHSGMAILRGSSLSVSKVP